MDQCEDGQRDSEKLWSVLRVVTSDVAQQVLLTADFEEDTMCIPILHGSSLPNLGQVQLHDHETWPQ